ncbi:MAG TPA: alpha/beta hydrolase [Tepidisphaeraceae bacterium]
MLRAVHLIIVAIYLILPAAAVGAAIAADIRRKKSLFVKRLSVTFFTAALLGITMCFIYTKAVRGQMSFIQVLLASYFAAGLLLILKAFDACLQWALNKTLRIRPRPRLPNEPPRRYAITAALLLRLAILFGIGLPYVMVAVLTYRPRVLPADDPLTQLRFPFQRVTFQAMDGTRLVGWWIPALDRPRKGLQRAAAGNRTVIVCHGLGSNKSNQLILARELVPNGFNALVFDFRAHGESAGQITTFGDKETSDVLGAVRWVRSTHPKESEKIFGVGASMGAAALITAAADSSTEGQAIDAVAVYGTFDNLQSLTRSVADTYFTPPVAWLTVHVGMPMACLQTGSDLTHFSPARAIARIWPRPVMVIHGQRDEIIAFDHGVNLFNSATQPKRALFLDEDHNQIINDDRAAQEVLDFFRDAKPLPVI